MTPGLMMHQPLLISSLIRHADRHHGEREIVSRRGDGGFQRSSWGQVHRRSRRLAHSLVGMGVKPGDRVGTLAWNHTQHLEAYYAISGMGAICHTVNPRLFPEQIAGIIRHAEDAVLLVDAQFLPLLEQLTAQLPSVRHIVVTAVGPEGLPAVSKPHSDYETLLASASDTWEWPELDENAAAGLCYTSGTTGNPKGVLYSHRSTVLHALSVALPDAMGLSSCDSVLPVVPQFHANAWGLPYATAVVGAKLVMPGPHLDGASLYAMMESEAVTFTAGVPTVWNGLMHYLKANGLKLNHLRRLGVGGAACPPGIVRYFEEEQGVQVLPGWGMTETSPVVTLNQPKAHQSAWTGEERLDLLNNAGRVLFGADLEIVDESGNPLPHDGKTFGQLMVQGHWVCRQYYREPQNPLQNGWFPTGDVAVINGDGFMRVTDRAKDVIKSGGEWISSVDLENTAASHPAVMEAAVIGVPHPHWGERPLLLVVKKPGTALEAPEMLQFLAGRVAKWWLPEEVVFVDSLPHTATGKLQKTALRSAWARYPARPEKTDI
jgi:acyl-CoA synthetase (AMP-forming)/AMP-acid ligase II